MDIYTDGSCAASWYHKRGLGGWAYVIVLDGKERSHAMGFAKRTAGHRMELTAVLEALRSLPENQTATIWTDCMEVIIAIQKHDHWAARGWNRRSRENPHKVEPVKDVELVKALHAEAIRHPGVEVRRVLRRGSRWNQEADRLANQARSQYKKALEKKQGRTPPD